MRRTVLFTTLSLLLCDRGLAPEGSAQEDPRANAIILDDTAIQNLRLKTEPVQRIDFEFTAFAIGRVEEIPANRVSVSTRISGRALEVFAFKGDYVEKDDLLFRIESRQPGNPPPVIELRAPQSGLVVESNAIAGQPVEPNLELLDISDRSEVWVVAQIPERHVANIDVGTRARITFPAIDGPPIEASLLRFGVNADRVAGAVEGVFQIENPEYRLQPGMRAELALIVDSKSQTLAIPKEAAQGDPTQRVVYVQDFELPNAFIKVPVVLGASNDRWIEVESGLFPGDDVVTSGSYFLGFAGSGAGMSLKEALDAAHGHEHSEDGSELTPEQRAARQREQAAASGSSQPSTPGWALYYAVIITFVAIAQFTRQRRNAHPADPAAEPEPSALEE